MNGKHAKHVTGGLVDAPNARGLPSLPSLSHDQNLLTIDFAALNSLILEKNAYAYRLEPLEPEWNDAGTRHSATCTGLVPGRYVFRVRASNNDGDLTVPGHDGGGEVLAQTGPGAARALSRSGTGG